MAERTPTTEQQAQLKRQSEQLAALDAEEKKLYSEDYQKTLTPQQYDAAAARLDELTAQRSQLSRSQTELAAKAYGVDPASLNKGESVTFTTRDGVKVSVGGTGVPSQNAAARANYAADDYEDDQIRSETAGPRATRTQTTTTTSVTGGDQRVTAMTPEMKSWTEKSSQASKLDEAAQRDSFLRSQGLENADKATQLKAITKARNQYDADGNSTFDKYKSNSNRDAVGAPPEEQYKTTSIAANKTGTQKVNDGEMSTDTAAKQSALGLTADQAAKDKITPDPSTETLSEADKEKLEKDKSGKLSSDVQQSQESAGTTSTRSEENFSTAKSSDNSSSITGKNVGSKSSDYSAENVSSVPENILHKYTSYTYRITLFFLTSKDFNNLVANPSSFAPKYSLISSAGGYAATSNGAADQKTKSSASNTTLRHPDFRTDFFIDGLNIQTVVGLNAKNKASNAVDISFTITEPYGLSLLDRLLSACETSEDRSINYMAQPYLLQVDLLASPTDEQLQRLQSTNNVIASKKIAVKLLEMKIKPSGTGTTYACTAQPYNHSAFDMITASLPVPMTVEAGTVGEFFSSQADLEKVFIGEIKSEEERVEKEIDKWVKDNTVIFANRKPTPEQIENQRQALLKGVKYKTKSLTAAYNAYMEKIVSTKKLALQIPTMIAFNIPSNEIANSKIVNAADSSTGDVRMQGTNTGVNKPDSEGFKDKQAFSFNAGYSIIDVIDTVMSKSEYVKKQLQTQASEQNQSQAANQYTGNSERTGNTTTAKKLSWYKILPTVALKDFDASTNTYSKSVLYSILPYTAANSYHPNFPKVNSQNVADSVVRTYDYLYTGKNKDVLRLDIDFDTSFYTLVTTKGDQVVRTGNDADSDKGDVQSNKYSAQNAEKSFPPVVRAFAGSNKNSVGTSKATDPDEQVIADMKTSIYSRQRGDALNIKLQIIGDPDFIKQDDIFFNPGSPDEYAKLLDKRLANNSKRPISENGQILFDAEQVYVRLNVKNAVDINDKIGIVNKQETLSNGRTTDGSFSGVYKVLTVTSDFSRGQFTQTLDMIRIPDTIEAPKKPIENKPITAIDINDKNAAAFGRRINAPVAQQPG